MSIQNEIKQKRAELEKEPIICIREINENIKRVFTNKPLTRPLRILNKNCNFKKRYDIAFDLKNEDRIEREKREYDEEYRARPEVKVRMREYRKRPEVKKKQRERQQRPEVKARAREYYREYNKRHEVKARAREYMKEYYKKNRDKTLKQQREHYKSVRAIKKSKKKMSDGIKTIRR